MVNDSNPKEGTVLDYLNPPATLTKRDIPFLTLLACFAAYFFYSCWYDSTPQGAEEHAKVEIRKLAQAEKIFHDHRPGLGTYASLDELSSVYQRIRFFKPNVSRRGGYLFECRALAGGQEFSLYAWPIDFPNTGRRVFHLDQSGELKSFANVDGLYSGEASPASDAVTRGEWSVVR